MEFLDNEFRIKSCDGNSGVFEGYASVFWNVDHHKEVVAKGAFKNTLEQWNMEGQLPKMLWQHDQKSPIGIWEEMYEDDYGLFVRGRLLLDIQKGKDAYALLQSKVIDGLSIGFQTKYSHKEKGFKILDEIDLLEVSLVTFNANPAAKIISCKDKYKESYSFPNNDDYRETIYFMDRLKSLRQTINNLDIGIKSITLEQF